MIRRATDALLAMPWVYELSQTVLAPGAESAIARIVARLAERLPPGSRLLDVGCGPRSRLWAAGLSAIGLDYSLAYMRAYRAGGLGVAASAERLPFASERFDGVWSIGLLHHLPDDVAAQAVQEMVRVCRPGGRVAILDGVYPRVVWRRPLAYWVRRYDRGRYMRREEQLRALLPRELSFTCERVTYAFNGLELLCCSAVSP